MYEMNMPNDNRMLIEAVENACARLRGVVGEYGNPADKRILDDLCAKARATKQAAKAYSPAGESVEISAETLKRMADALKKTKAALEKLRPRKQDEEAA
jgi:hypothetical protein